MLEQAHWDKLWRALADPTRRQILDLLVAGPQTTGQLAEAFPNLTRYAVMKHLGILQQAGLLIVERQGRFRWNYLNQIPIRALYERWLIRFMEPVAANLLSLKRHVEQNDPKKDDSEE